jgi:microcystin-dependent protein
MANYEATKYDFSGANLTGIEGIPTATIVPWSDSSVPTGFLECNGAAVSRSTYSALFAIVGTTYGAGDGSSTFNVPDLQDNVPVGKSNNKALASTGGANTVASTGNVGGSTANATLSTGQLASHSHSVPRDGPTNDPASGNLGRAKFGQNAGPGNFNSGGAGSGQGHSHNMSATFSGDATSVLQPYLAIIYIIKT